METTMKEKSLTVLVLAGGDSAEREISLDSARGMAKAVAQIGHRVLIADPARPEIEPTEDGSAVFGDAAIGETPPDVIDGGFESRLEFIRRIASYREYGVDIVLNGLHGGAGEDGTIQAVLDYIGLPYTGSRAAACALAMDKYRSKRLAQAAGVNVPKGLFFGRPEMAAGAAAKTIREQLAPPVVVKPNTQGSSVGLTVVASFEDLEGALAEAFRFDDQVIVENYVAGSEITVAILEDEGALPVLEIRPRSGLYDYYHKYQAGACEYLVPAPLGPAVAEAIAESARRTFHALGCRVYARVDFRLDAEGQHYMLETNTLPGMTALSLVPKAAKAAGIGYTDLVSRILRLSLQR